MIVMMYLYWVYGYILSNYLNATIQYNAIQSPGEHSIEVVMHQIEDHKLVGIGVKSMRF